MSSSRPIPLIGRIAIHLKMITHDQLAEVTQQQERSGHDMNLGDFMVEHGYLNPGQLTRLLAAQKQVIAKQRAKEAVATADAEPEIAPPAPRTQAPATVAQPAGATAAIRDPRSPSAAPPTESSLFDEPPPDTREPAGAPAPQTAASAPPPPSQTATSSAASGSALEDLLRAGIAEGASDIHIHSGMPLRLRVHGQFISHGDTGIPAAQAQELVHSALSAEQRVQFDAA